MSDMTPVNIDLWASIVLASRDAPATLTEAYAVAMTELKAGPVTIHDAAKALWRKARVARLEATSH